MSNDYISRADLMGHIEDEARAWGEEYDVRQILGDIEDFPAADVRPVVHGRWITKEYFYGDPGVGTEDMWVERLAEYGDCAYCSECGGYAGLDGAEEYKLSNFCPNCGADMRSIGERLNDASVGDDLFTELTAEEKAANKAEAKHMREAHHD